MTYTKQYLEEVHKIVNGLDAAIVDKMVNMIVDLRKNGGRLFYYGSSEAMIKDALFKSPTRRRLYEEGLYVPRSFIRIWPRNELIEWADRSKMDMK